MTLFEISNELMHLYTTEVDDAGEIQPDALAWLASIEEQEAEKLDAYVNVIRQLEEEESFVRNAAHNEAIRYALLIKVRANRIEWLKKQLKEHLERTGCVKKQTATLRTIRIQSNGGKLPLKIDAEVPQTHCKVVYQPDTESIRQALEAGEQLEFAHLEPRGTHLRIS